MKYVIPAILTVLFVTGCSYSNKDGVKYTNYGSVQNIKCESNNTCSIETSKSLAIVNSEMLPVSPSENDHLYSLASNTPNVGNVMWCVNQECKVTVTCKSMIGGCK